MSLTNSGKILVAKASGKKYKLAEGNPFSFVNKPFYALLKASGLL
jgi:hypothetical protein